MTSAREFTARLADLLSRERSAMAEFLVALADFDRQRLWAELGYGGLFPFLHRELGMSKAAAFYRKAAAELVQRFPDIVEPLRDGRLCITAVVEVAKVITPENRGEVLPRFFHCSKQEARAVSAAIAPDEAPPTREVVTVLRVEPSPERTVQPGELTIRENRPSDAPGPTTSPAAGPPPKRDVADPLTAELHRLHVTVSLRFLAKLEKARAALSHSRPGASAEEILEAGLDLPLARDAKRKGLVERPRKERDASAACQPAGPFPRSRGGDGSGSGRIPANVKRAVWLRDGGCCQWKLDSGGICGSTVRVQLDHVVPLARGGPSTVGNVRLLCAFHNLAAARLAFGAEWMDRYAGKRDGARAPATSTGPPPSAL